MSSGSSEMLCSKIAILQIVKELIRTVVKDLDIVSEDAEDLLVQNCRRRNGGGGGLLLDVAFSVAIGRIIYREPVVFGFVFPFRFVGASVAKRFRPR